MILELIVFLFYSVASISDLKKREVSDFVSYGLIVTAIVTNIFLSIFSKDSSFIINSLFGLSVFYFIGQLLFFCQVWGGADSKILIGTAGLFGLSFPLIQSFVIQMFINLGILGIPYCLTWVAYHKYHLKKEEVSIPFVPMFPIALLFTSIYGNSYSLMVKAIFL